LKAQLRLCSGPPGRIEMRDTAMGTDSVDRNCVLLVLAMLVGAAIAAAETPATMPASSSAENARLVTGKLLANVKQVVPGEPFDLGVHLKLDGGWHVYWKNPGDAGVATDVRFAAPDGYSVGPLRWPSPKQFTQPGGIVSYGYEDEVLLVATVAPPPKLPEPRSVLFKAEASWLACKATCVPGKSDLELALPAAPESKKAEPDNAELFAKWAEVTPRMAPPLALTDQAGNRLDIADWRGSYLVVEWINPDCPYVKRHHVTKHTMVDLAAKYATKGVKWVAVNSTYYMTPETTAQWHKEWALPYPILIDRDGKAGKAWGAKTTPHMFVVDKTGQIIYEGGIDDDPRGNKETPTNYVAKALDEALAGRPVSAPKARQYGCSVKYAE
jgi:DsbC/DsbD-like thiol-disulfide interchange protein